MVQPHGIAGGALPQGRDHVLLERGRIVHGALLHGGFQSPGKREGPRGQHGIAELQEAYQGKDTRRFHASLTIPYGGHAVGPCAAAHAGRTDARDDRRRACARARSHD